MSLLTRRQAIGLGIALVGSKVLAAPKRATVSIADETRLKLSAVLPAKPSQTLQQILERIGRTHNLSINTAEHGNGLILTDINGLTRNQSDSIEWMLFVGPSAKVERINNRFTLVQTTHLDLLYTNYLLKRPVDGYSTTRLRDYINQRPMVPEALSNENLTQKEYKQVRHLLRKTPPHILFARVNHNRFGPT